MKLSDLEKLNSIRTRGHWEPTNELEEKYWDDEDYCDTWTISPIEWETDRGQPGYGIHHDDARFIAVMANHADAFLELVRAAELASAELASDEISFASAGLLKALRKLEEVK